jgi:uncharacterized protein YkwD
MPFNMTIRPAAVAVIAAASLFALLALSRADVADAAGCPGENAKARGTAGNAMFCLINRARTRRGLPALQNDGRLARVAGRQSFQMVHMRFFGHNSPASGGLVHRVKRSGFAPSDRQWWCGENLGFGTGRAQSAARVFSGWMHSTIHEHAILYGHFKRMGVGVARGTPEGGRSGMTYVVTFGG